MQPTDDEARGSLQPAHDTMHIDQKDFGDYRIFARADDAPGGGYFASVAVEQVRNVDGAPRSVAVLERLNDGFLFPTRDSALHCAMQAGKRTARDDSLARP